MGKELCFHKIGPIMMPKCIGYKIFTIFLICMCERHFRNRRVRYTSRRQVLDHSRPKGNLSVTVYTMFLEKYPFVYLRDQAIFMGHGAGANVNCRMEKK